MKRQFLTALVVAVATITPVAALGQDGPLERIARRVPLDAEGMVMLTDVAASTRQVAPFSAASPEMDRKLMPFGTLHPPNGFDLNLLLEYFPNGAVSALGFSVFDIGQMAGWGKLPAAPVIIAGVAGKRDAVRAALVARRFGEAARGGTTVWHLRDDYKVSLRNYNSDPFTGGIGVSQRFAFDGEYLLFARGWAQMDRMLAGSVSLMDDADAAAILRAGYLAQHNGDLLDVTLIAEQPDRIADAMLILDPQGERSHDDLVAEIMGRPGFGIPGLPPFARYGLMLWQDGARVTGAIAIPYRDAATAWTARALFEALLETMDSLVIERPIGDILSGDRAFAVVETADRAVLLLGFRKVFETSAGMGSLAFSNNPGRRLHEMLIVGDLSLLIGRVQHKEIEIFPKNDRVKERAYRRAPPEPVRR